MQIDDSILIPVYIEKIDISTGWMLLDFPDDNNFNKFLNKINFEFTQKDYRSIIEIKGFNFSNNSKPKEGSYYKLPEEVINVDWNSAYQPLQDNNSHSSVIAFTIDLKQQNLDFGRALSKNVVFGEGYLEDGFNFFNNLDNEKEYFNQIKKWPNNTRLIVRNVGQGNWNEIHFDDNHSIIYDIGVSVRYSAAEIKSLIRNRKIDGIINHETAILEKTTLIISHWDIDHYLAVFEFDNDYLSNLGKIIFMANPPSKTSQEAVKKIRSSQKNYGQILEISPADRGKGRGCSSILHLILQTNCFTLFKGTKSSNRNKSGLSIAIWTKKSLAILPADHHYDQIDKYIIPYLPKDLETYLIIPHHGGHAGAYKLIHKIKKAKTAIISVGKNQWKHPFRYIIEELNIKFEKTWKTNIKSDFNFILN